MSLKRGAEIETNAPGERSIDESLGEIMLEEITSTSNGGDSKEQEARGPKKPEGRGGGIEVKAEDLALREDICYQIFGDVGPLIRDFSCAWDHKVVMHGRMYVTERRLCFYANFFGLEAKMSLRHEDIARSSKGNSAIFIPNVIVVQDKSGKDFVFRAFWERDECHSLLEKLRVEANELGAKAEEKPGSKSGVEIQSGGGGLGDGLVATTTAVPRDGAAAGDPVGNGSLLCPADVNASGGTENPLEYLTEPTQMPPTYSPKASSPGTRQGVGGGIGGGENGPSTLPRGDSGSPSEASCDVGGGDARRPVSLPYDPPLSAGMHHSSPFLRPPPPPPPQRHMTPGSSASLPSSPSASSRIVAAAAAAAAASGGVGGSASGPVGQRARSLSMTPGGSSGVDGDTARGGSAAALPGGGSVVAVIAPPRPAKLGLAVLGADHDVPSSPKSLVYFNGSGSGGLGVHERKRILQQQQHREQQQEQQPQQQQQRSPLRMTAVITGGGRGGWGSPARPAVPTASTTPDAYASAKTAGRRRRGGGGDGGMNCDVDRTSGVENHEAGGVGDVLHQEEEKEEEENVQEDQQRDRGGRPSLGRRGSMLWNRMMGGRVGAGEKEGEDPAADRKAMEEAIKAGGKNHAEVATAEFDVSVKEFYQRFVADDAPYGLPDFHMSRGDWEVDADEWQQMVDEEEGATAGGKGGGKGASNGDGGASATRAIRFKTPLHITFMSSPGQVRTLKRQRCRFFGRQGCIVETQTTVEDRIPLSDNFHVEDRWIIRPASSTAGYGGKDGSGRQCCTATVTWRCVWHKFTVIKGLIEGKAGADVKSFNIAYLEGMRAHLVESKGGATSGPRALMRRPSLRESILSAASGSGGGRRASLTRERSFSGRSLLSSVAGSSDDVGARTGLSGFEDEAQNRCLPAIRVFSVLFMVYISLFWVRDQMRDGGDWQTGLGGDGGTGGIVSKEELMRLYGEWGRSSLALLDVREETRRLSAELRYLELEMVPAATAATAAEAAAAGSSRRLATPPVGSKGKDPPTREGEASAIEQLLREIEEKVSGISQRADSALAALDSTASQIRDAMVCPHTATTAADGASDGSISRSPSCSEGVCVS